ncbi:hypothetical protein F1737_09255 [Methanoplanus sp. FWC-SCC4]|uniref:Glycine zipper domain-containing protein n=1 Tax=Methanochimaera problematica TaxID=2609417 RepID=A0AA97I4Y3_9EURY|nr:hypothetical protein [Methanoplanus sp. FWC-SCC4]WOF16861.1 hypothetical protein F1737_09255 [Methanoplanus sp. FWC-SCC4]
MIYTVKREKKEVSRGLMGALAGGGIGGVLGGILGREEGSITDAIGGAIGGAAVGGAFEGYRGYEESRENRTAFAALLAEKVSEAQNEIMEIIEAQREAGEALKEKSLERRAIDEEKEQEIRSELEDVLGDLLALKEEIDFLEEDGKNVEKAKSRAQRAERLYSEAESSCSDKDYSSARTKIKASRSMIDGAVDLLSEE